MTCPDCKGTGVDLVFWAENCTHCGGVGVLLRLNPEGPHGRGLDGRNEPLYLERACPKCKGAKVLPRQESLVEE